MSTRDPLAGRIATYRQKYGGLSVSTSPETEDPLEVRIRAYRERFGIAAPEPSEPPAPVATRLPAPSVGLGLPAVQEVTRVRSQPLPTLPSTVVERRGTAPARIATDGARRVQAIDKELSVEAERRRVEDPKRLAPVIVEKRGTAPATVPLGASKEWPELRALELANRGIRHGELGLGESAGTVLRYGAARTGIEQLDDWGREMETHFGERAEEFAAPKMLEGSVVDRPELLRNPLWWAYNVGETLPSFAASMVPAVGAGKAIQLGGAAMKWTPQTVKRLARIGAATAGGATGGALEGAGTYQEMLERGADEPTAARAAELMTLATAGLNAFSLDRMLTPSKAAALQRYLTSGAVEALTEYMEEPAEVGIKLAMDAPGFTGEQAREQLRQGANVVGPSFLLGMLGGAAGGAERDLPGAEPPLPAAPPAPPMSGFPPAIEGQEPAAAVPARTLGTLRRIPPRDPQAQQPLGLPAPEPAEVPLEPGSRAAVVNIGPDPERQTLGSATPAPTSGVVNQPLPAGVAVVPTAELYADPPRFQYKATDAEGITPELKSVKKYDPKLAGIALVWRDQADRRTYMVNGHNRLRLAQRTGYPEMLVRYINDEATTAEEARAIGALANIAEGRGTAVDAAKLFRDSGVTPERLSEEGVSLTGAVARDGLALGRLAPSLFDRVATGQMAQSRGVIIGQANLSPEQQVALVQMVEQQEDRGRKVLDRDVAELARFVAGAGETRVSQETLFGKEAFTHSLALEKAQLSAYIREKLSKERRTFGFVARGDRAEQLERAGAGTIDREKSEGIAKEAAQAEELYAKESLYSGPVSTALNRAARELAAGGDARSIREQLYEEVRAHIAAIASGRAAPGGERPRPADPRGSDPAAAAVTPQPAPQRAPNQPPDLEEVRRRDRELQRQAASEEEGAEPPPESIDTETGSLFERGPAYGRDGAVRESAADYGADLFGEAPPASPPPSPASQQEALFTEPRGPQGRTAAMDDARQTVSLLRGRVERGAARPSEVRRYEAAAALLRSLQGERMSAEDVRRATREMEPEGAPRDEAAGDLFGVRETAPAYGAERPRFYSRLQRAIENAPFNAAPAAQWAGYLGKQPIAAGEKDWVGIDAFLDERAGERVTRDELLERARERGVQLGETVLPEQIPMEWESLRDGVLWARGGYKIERLPNGKWRYQSPGGLASHHESVEEAKAQAMEHRRNAREDRRSTKFESYTEPGGENYREILITLDGQEPSLPDGVTVRNDPKYGWMAERRAANGSQDVVQGNSREEAMAEARRHFGDGATSDDFRSNHFDQPNVLAHARVKDRTLPNGERVLFIEEIQSDWHQKGRKQGYGTPLPWVVYSQDTNEAIERYATEPEAASALERLSADGTPRLDVRMERRTDAAPNAPFKKTEEWLGLAWRRLVDEAVSGGYDRIAWTTGAQQADRYDLSKQVSRVLYASDYQHLRAFDLNGAKVLDQVVPPEKLADHIGKEAAERLLDSPGPDHRLAGVELQVGGEGMKAYYDRMIPSVVRDYAKKMGVKLDVEPTPTTATERTLTGFRQTQTADPALFGTGTSSIRVTPELKGKVKREGQYLWEREEGTEMLARRRETAEAYAEIDPSTLAIFQAVRAGRPLTPEQKRQQMDLFNEDTAIAFGSAEQAGEVADNVAEGAGEMADFTANGVPTSRARFKQAGKKATRRAWVDIRGQKVSSLIDIHRLMYPFRDPLAERFHVLLFNDEGDVLSHTMETSGAIDYVNLTGGRGGESRWIERVARRARRLGATSTIVVHNHPSGNPRASTADVLMTDTLGYALQQRNIRLAGQYVIDHERGSWITPGEDGQSTPHPVAIPRGTVPASDWTQLHVGSLGGFEGPLKVARLVRDTSRPDRIDVLYLSTQRAAVAIEPHRMESLKTIAKWLPERLKALGANNAIIVTGSEAQRLEASRAVQRERNTLRKYDEERGVRIYVDGVSDVVHIEGGSLRRTSEREWDDGVERQLRPARAVFETERSVGDDDEAGARPIREGAGPARPAARDADRARSVPPRVSATARRLIQRRQRPAGARADFASTAALEPPALERTPATTPDGRTLRPIQPPELVRMATALLGGRAPFVKKYSAYRGLFYGEPGNPRIGLNPSLGRDYDQFARTLAHEVGHLIDFLPDQDMRRGNILGRLATLKGYLSHTIDEVPTDPSLALTPKDRRKLRAAAAKKVAGRGRGGSKAEVAEAVAEEYQELLRQEIEDRRLLTREQIQEELLALSEWWRPFDRATASDSHIAYRESGPEVYADAMSVLLNSPGELQARAPVFFDAFLAYMERKPEMAGVYDDLQALLAGGEDAVMAARKEELEADFRRGEEIQRKSEQKEEKQSFLSYLKQAFVQSTAPVTDAERKRVGKKKPAHSAEHAVKMALEEYAHADNVNRVMLMDIERSVHAPMLEAGIDEEQAGRFLMLVRIAEGDRGGMAEQAKEAIMELTSSSTWAEARAAYVELQNAPEGEDGASLFDPDLLALAESGVLNPHGYTPAEARETLAALKKELGAEKYDTLENLMGRFRGILFRSVITAVRVGSYNAETFNRTILPNRLTYTPFAVLDYFNGRVPAGVRQQVGTVKGVANPFTTAILKGMALNRLNEHQKAKTAVLSVLDVDFPGMAGKEEQVNKYKREKRPERGRENLMYLRDGKLYYREVDAYIAKTLEKSDLGAAERLVGVLSSWNYRVFHPLYVTLSIAWQVRNVQRDWKRTYKNLAARHAGKPKHRQAIEAVLDLARLNAAYLKTSGIAWRNARRQYDPVIREMLKDRALGRAFHSFTPREEDLKYERLMQEYGLRPAAEAGAAKRAAKKTGRAVETMGVYQETWSKVATYKLLEKEGIVGRERAYMVRNYSGTPDSTRRGLASEATNGILMYANVIVAGIRADSEVALQPSTAAGYWLRSVITDFAPKALMAAAVAGLLGDELEDWYAHIPNYDKEKYIILPIPPFWSENERGERKAVYMRLPHDDLNRILAGAVWSMMMDDRPHSVWRTLGLIAGEFPGVAPLLSLTHKWYQVGTGTNPRDSFRGRDVVPRTQWDAGGWPRMKEMLRYTLGELGVVSQVAGIFTQASPLEGQAAKGETFLRSIPGISTLVKITDRGLTESRYWELDWEAKERAKIKADLSEDVRRASAERARLNRLGTERLKGREPQRRLDLNAWNRTYLSLTAAMEHARDTEDPAGYERARLQLEQSVQELNAGRFRAEPRTKPRPTRAPSLPRRQPPRQ